MSDETAETMPPLGVDYVEIRKIAHQFFSEYLEGEAKNIGFILRSMLDSGTDLDAQVETMDQVSYTVRLFTGLLDPLTDIHAAIEKVGDSGPNDTYVKLADHMAPFYQHLLGQAGPQPAKLLRIALQTSLYMSILFVAFHEFAHVRSGHFNLLFSAPGRRVAPERRSSIVECEETEFRLGVARDSLKAARVPLNKHLELEADIIAFVGLLDAGEELFVPDLSPQKAESGAGPIETMPALTSRTTFLPEMALYATCLCLFLFEIKRRRSKKRSGYPRPFTRILAVFRQFVVGTKRDWQVVDHSIVAPITGEEAEYYVTTLVNVISMCDFFGEVTGLDLPQEYKLHSEAAFFNDALIISDMIRSKIQLETLEARELASLDTSAKRFKRLMEPFRIPPWDF